MFVMVNSSLYTWEFSLKTFERIEDTLSLGLLASRKTRRSRSWRRWRRWRL